MNKAQKLQHSFCMKAFLYALFALFLSQSPSTQITSVAHAAPISVYSLIERSTTGRTIVLNMGSLDGLADKDIVTLLKHNPKEGNDYLTDLVAQCKTVKVLNNRSIWFCFKIFKKSQLKKGNKYIASFQNELLKGRVTPKVKRRKLVSKKGEHVKSLKDYFRGYDKEQLEKNKDRYRIQERISENKTHTDHDFEVIDITEWKPNTSKLFELMEADIISKRKFYPKDVYTSPYQLDFLHRRNLDTYEKMIVNYLARVNDPEFNIETFYTEQLRNEVNPEFKATSHNRNEYLIRYAQDQKELARKRELYRKLLAQGPNWSDSYTDEDLALLIYEKGVLDEEERRRIIISRRHKYQFGVSMGLNLVNNENITDSKNTQSFKSSFDIFYEYYLSHRYPKLEDFTFEGGFRRSADAISVGLVNAVTLEYSFSAAINWYPYLRPNTIESNLFFFGASFRFGRANMSINSLGEEGVYSVSALPGLRAGIRYNFRSRWGIRAMLSYEQLQFSRIERNFVGSLPESTNGTDMKVSFGVSYYQ